MKVIVYALTARDFSEKLRGIVKSFFHDQGHLGKNFHFSEICSGRFFPCMEISDECRIPLFSFVGVGV